MGTAAINGELWGARAEAWSQIQEGQCRPLYEAALEAIDLASGTLLDAGCGSGLALQLAAKQGATVTGIDASRELIAIARDRVPGADLQTGELEELPYADARFDRAMAFNSVQYAGDPARALAELARVVRPGGLVCVATWGQPQNCEITAILGQIGPLMPPPAAGTHHEGPFSLSAPGQLEAFVAEAGLIAHDAAEVASPMHYPDLDTALTGQASSGVLVLAAQHSGTAAVDKALRAALAPFIQPDGSVHLENTFRFLVANTKAQPR